MVEEGTPTASALPLLFLEVFHQPAALPAFDHVRAQELMASVRLVATLLQILHTVVLAQSPAPQRRTLARGKSPATCPKISGGSAASVRLKGARQKTKKTHRFHRSLLQTEHFFGVLGGQGQGWCSVYIPNLNRGQDTRVHSMCVSSVG